MMKGLVAQFSLVDLSDFYALSCKNRRFVLKKTLLGAERVTGNRHSIGYRNHS